MAQSKYVLKPYRGGTNQMRGVYVHLPIHSNGWFKENGVRELLRKIFRYQSHRVHPQVLKGALSKSNCYITVFNCCDCMYHDSQRLLNFKWPKTATSLAEDEWIEHADRPPPFFIAKVYRDVRHVHESRLQLHVLVFVHEPQDFRVRRERDHLRGCCSDCSVVHY